MGFLCCCYTICSQCIQQAHLLSIMILWSCSVENASCVWLLTTLMFWVKHLDVSGGRDISETGSSIYASDIFRQVSCYLSVGQDVLVLFINLLENAHTSRFMLIWVISWSLVISDQLWSFLEFQSLQSNRDTRFHLELTIQTKLLIKQKL